MLIRRHIGLFIVILSFIVLSFGIPFALPICYIFDLSASNRLASTRALFFIMGLLAMEIFGVLISFIIWIIEFPHLNKKRFEHRNYLLQNWWGMTIAKIGIRIYKLKFSIEEPFEITNESFILFIRHSSFIDTFLPIFLISSKHQIRLRYILKEELLFGPCLNIVGNRIPNVFVRRDKVNTQRQLEEIRNLVINMPIGEGVVLYPEGTRFTKEKQEYIGSKAKIEGEKSMMRTLRFKSILPPQMGGALTLLETIPNADALFCSHSGLESTVNLKHLLSGQLVGTTIRVNFHQVNASEIPINDERRKNWFDDQWAQVDRLVTKFNSIQKL